MIHTTISLRDRFPRLARVSDATVTLYLPDNLTEMGRGEEKHPCLIVCPGGGYGFCSQREAEPVALHFLPEGFGVFVLNYSVAPRRYPTQLREVAALLELIHQNADVWHCDVTRIALMGFSAGAHLAAHYVNAYDSAAVRELFPGSKPVQASLLCYPVITADPKWRHSNSFLRLTGKDVLPPEEEAAFSCQRMVRKETPPTFLWHTAADGDVPVMNSLLYAQALAEAGVPFELHVFPQGHHGLATSDHLTIAQPEDVHAYDHLWLELAKRWLYMVFDRH